MTTQRPPLRPGRSSQSAARGGRHDRPCGFPGGAADDDWQSAVWIGEHPPSAASPTVRATRCPSTVCGIATVDCNGRVAEGAVITALGWAPGTRLDIRESGGLVLITADRHAVFRMTRKGQLRLPATIRHWCGLTPGSRVMLAAHPATGLLVVHPPAALHAMIIQYHTTVLGGDAE